MDIKIRSKEMCFKSALKGWNLSQLSAVSKVSRTTISAIRSGKTCSIATANKIANALNIRLEDIAEREDV